MERFDVRGERPGADPRWEKVYKRMLEIRPYWWVRQGEWEDILQEAATSAWGYLRRSPSYGCLRRGDRWSPDEARLAGYAVKLVRARAADAGRKAECQAGLISCSLQDALAGPEADDQRERAEVIGSELTDPAEVLEDRSELFDLIQSRVAVLERLEPADSLVLSLRDESLSNAQIAKAAERELGLHWSPNNVSRRLIRLRDERLTPEEARLFAWPKRRVRRARRK